MGERLFFLDLLFSFEEFLFKFLLVKLFFLTLSTTLFGWFIITFFIIEGPVNFALGLVDFLNFFVSAIIFFDKMKSIFSWRVLGFVKQILFIFEIHFLFFIKRLIWFISFLLFLPLLFVLLLFWLLLLKLFFIFKQPLFTFLLCILGEIDLNLFFLLMRLLAFI